MSLTGVEHMVVCNDHKRGAFGCLSCRDVVRAILDSHNDFLKRHPNRLQVSVLCDVGNVYQAMAFITGLVG